MFIISRNFSVCRYLATYRNRLLIGPQISNLRRFYSSPSLKRFNRAESLNSSAKISSETFQVNGGEDLTSEISVQDYSSSEPPQDAPLRPAWDRGGLTKSNALTPLLASMRKLIDANKNSVCLVQVGSFYELYFEQASTIAPKLGIKVALRKTSNHTVPMAGFPVSQLAKFVKILVHDLHYNVAIIDQYPSQSDTLMHRKVSRVVTPGTLIDESFLNYSQNNYLVGIYIPSNSQVSDPDLPVGLLWVDISVGDFYVQLTTMGELAADLKRISPSEVIMSKEFHPDSTPDLWIVQMAELNKYFIRYHKTTYRDFKLEFLTDIVATRKLLELLSVREEAAMNMVLSYVNFNLPDRTLLLEPPTRYITDKYLHMDSRTRDALELTGRSTFDTVSVVGSLLNTIKRTVTPSGTRRLAQWVKSPILDTKELLRRQGFVSLFKNHSLLRYEIRHHLANVGDFTRSLQRLALNTGSQVAHLQAIGEGITRLAQLLDLLVGHTDHFKKKEQDLVQQFLQQFDVPQNLALEILETLPSEPVIKRAPENYDSDLESTTEETSVEMYVNRETLNNNQMVFSVRKDHNSRLLLLHASLEEVLILEHEMLQAIQEVVVKVDSRANVSAKDQYAKYLNVIHISCRLKYSDAICEALGGDIREKKKTSLIYKPRQWETLQDEKVGIVQAIETEEKEIISVLKDTVLARVSQIRNCGRSGDLIDITASFAVFAEENDMVCPRFVKSPTLNVSKGRHVVVESSLKANGQMFSGNDTKLGTDGHVWVISGPNMGGKSTYLRQNALIVILAQIGSYVPASSASLGIVDRIFTRIGASDDIFSDLSTFMVEMVETSNILKNATGRSLAIVDEVGRGTSGDEGLAIAYATLVTLLQKNKCRTLFATHFGKEIKTLLESDDISLKSLRFYRTKILEHPGDNGKVKFLFDHTLEPGISKRSYALEVARLAGFPEHLLGIASRALEHMKREKGGNIQNNGG
ncbi:CIC11C00000002648 [Sungouiella intermedia]|uniref:CIC11C00000002648 n=1 Tax=Sungouiella intermedia TaxID=45354 RepID=A0A1L0CVN6_9ASCO|nr:CIC11C00000002648 [[Candida] intermedia]